MLKHLGSREGLINSLRRFGSMEKRLRGTRYGCQTGMRCERELSVFRSRVLRDSTEVATRDIGTGCGCGELPSAVQQYEELFTVA